MDLRLRYSADDSVELTGSPGVLRALANLLGRGESEVVAVPVPTTRPDPYDGWLESIAIHPEEEPLLLIRRERRQLVLSGGRNSLAILADNVETLANSSNDGEEHMHIEYFPGHYYLREGSVPLVLDVS